MYHYSVISKIRFYFSYIVYKIILFKDVKKGLSRIYLAECIWFLNQFFLLDLKLPEWFKTNYFVTKFGKFYIEPDLLSTISISPAFEREDINYLLKLLGNEINSSKKVLFLDVGANMGLYSVIVGNAFRNKIDILAFEPGTSYLSVPSLTLLEKNLKVNKLLRVNMYPIGIGSENSKKNNKEGFKTKRLETIIGVSYFKKYDSVFIKVDVDDFAVDALKGIEDNVKCGKKVTLLVEDFVDPKTIPYMSKKYSFLKKISTYNSFWVSKKE